MSVNSYFQCINCQHKEAMYYYLLLLLSCIIGTKSRSGNELSQMRIVGGTKCTVKTYPFMVSVHLFGRPHVGNYNHYCGGSLVNSKWVLSAAHCYTEDEYHKIENYLVLAGMSLQSQYKDSKVQRSAVVAIVTKGYNPERLSDDIALFKLKMPMRRTQTVDYTTLPGNNLYPRDLLKINPICTAMGWGITKELTFSELQNLYDSSKLITDHLMCVNLPLIRHNKCKKIIKNITVQLQIEDLPLADSAMCTLYPKDAKDACTHDSGGPLVCNRIQQGLVSWGLGCAQRGYPGVFTRIDKFIGWIKYNCKNVTTRKLNVSKKPKFRQKKRSTYNTVKANPSSILLCNNMLCLLTFMFVLLYELGIYQHPFVNSSYN